MKILNKIFYPAGKNNVNIGTVVFDKSFISIQPLLNTPIEFSKICEPEKRNAFINRNLPVQIEIDFKESEFLLLIPGAIDSHVHFDTPGFEFREDFEHASSAAACGGVTTVIDMPCTSIPPVTSKENFATKILALKNRSAVDYLFWGGIRGNDFDDIEKLKRNIYDLADCGVVGFKAYFTSGMTSYQSLTFEQMKIAADIVKKTNLPLAVHAEDNEMVTSRTKQFQTAGMKDWKAYCKARDISAETKAIENIIKIAEETECKIHVVHLSSGAGLKLIREAQHRGLNITTETCPHYLHFTQSDFDNPKIANFLKTAPPVKFEDDKEALWTGLNDGTISFVVTDHAGCDPDEEKSSDNFWEVYGGIPGVEHRVSYLFSEGFLKNRLTLEKTIDLLSTKICSFFNIKNKGVLLPGYDADFSLINLWADKKINSKEMHSKGKYTPFDGMTVNAVVEQTYLRGRKIYDRTDDGKFTYDYGKFVMKG